MSHTRAKTRYCAACTSYKTPKSFAKHNSRRCNACVAAGAFPRSQVCIRCGKRGKIPKDFYVSVRNPDGTVAAYLASCKTCTVKRTTRYIADRYRTDPTWRAERLEHKRDYNNRYREAHPRDLREGWERIKADPRKHALYLEKRRMERRLRLEREGGIPITELRTAASSYVVSDTDFPMLPSAPLAAVVARIAEAETRGNPWGYHSDKLDAANHHRRDALVAARAGVSDRTLRAWRSGERPTVQFDLADRVITRLDLLWFDVYEPGTPGFEVAQRAFEGEQAAA